MRTHQPYMHTREEKPEHFILCILKWIKVLNTCCMFTLEHRRALAIYTMYDADTKSTGATRTTARKKVEGTSSQMVTINPDKSWENSSKPPAADLARTTERHERGASNASRSLPQGTRPPRNNYDAETSLHRTSRTTKYTCARPQ